MCVEGNASVLSPSGLLRSDVVHEGHGQNRARVCACVLLLLEIWFCLHIGHRPISGEAHKSLRYEGASALAQFLHSKPPIGT